MTYDATPPTCTTIIDEEEVEQDEDCTDAAPNEPDSIFSVPRVPKRRSCFCVRSSSCTRSF